MIMWTDKDSEIMTRYFYDIFIPKFFVETKVTNWRERLK